MEENKKEKAGKKVVLIVLVLLSFICVGVGCFFLGQNSVNKNSSNKENNEEKNDKKDDKKDDVIVIDDITKEKLNTIIEKILICPVVDGEMNLYTSLLNGKNGLTDEEKFSIAMGYTEDNQEPIYEDELPSELKYLINNLRKVTYEEYENKYREIFNDEPVINENTMRNLDVSGSVAYFNKEARIMYVYTGFGGYCDTKITFVNYSLIDGNYVVNTTVTDTYQGNVITKNINWIFDNNLRFIKTEVVK